MAASKVFHKFCSNLPSSKYVFRSGKVANFVGGQYLTTVQAEIDELNAEIEAGHPHMYVDTNETTVDSESLDPLAKLRKSIIEQYIKDQQKAVNPENDMGNSVSQKNVATSQTLAAITAPVTGKK